MSSQLFFEYRHNNEAHFPVAAAQVTGSNIRPLSIFTGGTAVSKKVTGGTMMYCGLILNGVTAKIGDYVIADRGKVFIAFPKETFEANYTYKGILRDPVV